MKEWRDIAIEVGKSALFLFGGIVVMWIGYSGVIPPLQAFPRFSTIVQSACYVIGLLLLIVAIVFIFLERRSRIPKRFMRILREFGINANTISHNTSCEVFHDVEPKEYSKLTTALVENSDLKSIFAMLKIEPRLFYEEVVCDVADKNNLEELVAAARSRFTHFPAMDRKAHSAKNGDGKFNAHRVLVTQAGDWVARNRAHLRFFSKLNGDHVDCFAVDAYASALADCKFLTDHAIFEHGSYRICTDYYEESQTLIITFIPRSIRNHHCCGALNTFRDFDYGSVQPFVALEQYIKTHCDEKGASAVPSTFAIKH